MPQKRVKLKLKSSARKPLVIISVVVVVIIIILAFYFNRIGELKNLGYSEEAVHSIIFKFKYSYIMDIGENKTLNAAFESDDYIEDNLDNYAKIDYENQKHLIRNINKLLDKGYSVNEVNLIISKGDDKSVSDFTKRDKVKYIEEFLSVDFAKLENLDRYVEYQDKENDDAETTVLYVNMDFDKEDYVDPLVIDDFDDYVLVNKHRQLSSEYVPDDLVKIKDEYVKADGDVEIERNVAKAFYDMAEAASKDGMELMVSSGYRSYKDQEEITNTYLELYGQNYVDNYVAKPGFSEHQTAMSLDIASKSVSTFIESDEYGWMMDNAYKYGFILRYPKSKEDITGYKCEAWHYRYVGKKIAKYIHENNITYDEYYVMFLDN